MPSLSVIIPTHRRPEILEKCLEHLRVQTIGGQLEVIVVSDGKHDKTAALLAKHAAQEELVKRNVEPVFKYIEIPKSHQGVARNRGVAEATAPLILFIGDDIFLNPDACAKHLETHALLNKKTHTTEAVLGFTTWDPALKITPTMRWLERSGWQFGYPLIEEHADSIVPPEIQHRFTYTSHISLPTAIAKAHPFREDVKLYGWEDIEWGLRLKQANVALYYQPAAKAYHHHVMTLADSLKRMETLGKSALEIERKNPQLKVVPRGFKRTLLRIVSLLPTMRGKHTKAFLKGVSS